MCAGDKLSGKVEIFEELSKLTDSISWPFINCGQCPENDPYARQSYYISEVKFMYKVQVRTV